MRKKGNWFQKIWHICSGGCFLLAAALLLCLLLSNGVPQSSAAEPVVKAAAQMADFTIVVNEENWDTANALAVYLKMEYGVGLPVELAQEYQGDYAICIDTAGFNSYGSYKYSISWEETEASAFLHIDGSGKSLETAIEKFKSSIKNTGVFPFGMETPVIAYEWNTTNVNLTGLGFQLEDTSTRQLANGVELWEMKYNSFAYGKVQAYAVVVKSGAQAQMRVVTEDRDPEQTYTEKYPAPKHTVEKYRKMLTQEGYEVLAISNGSFYDLNDGKTMVPWGMQIVDGKVLNEPSKIRPNHSDNWFGLTVTGEYVISDTEGYEQTYEGRIVQGIGGGLVIMRDGVPTPGSTDVDYRTVIGYTKDGSMVLMTVEGANYAVVAQILMDMDIDVDTILNLDGGGSTTLHTKDEDGLLTQYMCETGVERQVADAVAIVIKKD